MVSKGARAYILDLSPPEGDVPTGAVFIKCDVTSWDNLVNAFKQAGHVDIAILNAGVSEECDYFEDSFNESGDLLEPRYDVVKVNYLSVLNSIKLALSFMRKQGTGGSIVITSSSTAYAPEQSLPVYSATKLAVRTGVQDPLHTNTDPHDVVLQLIGLVRALRSTLPRDNISINAVAPAATITKLLPPHLATPLLAAGLPVNSAHMVARAVVYSAVAMQERSVELYGKDVDTPGGGKWNGRTILVLGEQYTELEARIAELRPQWLGEENARLTCAQQAVTDFQGDGSPGGE